MNSHPQSRTSLSIRLVVFSIAIGLLGPRQVATADALSPIDARITAGTSSQALAEVRRRLDELPPGQRLTAWEHGFEGGVSRVVYGKHRLYYQMSGSFLRNAPPGRENPLKTVSVNNSRSDWDFLVVCLAMETGEIRWSRGVNGLVNLAVDPETDRLYLYREKLMIVDPEKGTILEQMDLPGDGRAIRGLWIGSRLVIDRQHGSDWIAPESRITVFSTTLKRAQEIVVGDYWFLAPDERVRLAPKADGWEGRDEPAGKVMWSTQAPVGRFREPLWVAGNPVWAAGSESTRGTVTSLDASTGETRWEAVLGFGVYESNLHQLRGGAYPDDWRPLTALDGNLLAIDGSGQLVFIDPGTGRVIAAVRLHRDYLGMPVQLGGQLVVTSFDWVRSYSLAALYDPAACVEAALRVREARCLRALGQGTPALAVLDRLLERAPRFREGWMERALVCDSLGDGAEAAFSRVQALALSGRSTSEDLRQSDGLLRLYDLGGRPGWSLAESSGRVYAGTLGGTLWSVRVDNLEAAPVTNVNHEIVHFKQSAELPTASSGGGLYSPIPAPGEGPDPRIPNEWWTVGGGVGNAVVYQGRQFRPLAGGAVRVLSDYEMKDFPAVLDGVKDWNLHLSEQPPLGYGEGVFALDGNLRPASWLVRPAVAGKKPEAVEIQLLEDAAETIGLVVCSTEGAALQVYTRDGRLIREAPLGRFTSGWAEQDRLIRLGNGYLFSDRQLVRVSSHKDQPIWRFGPALTRTESDRASDRWRYFGVPLLAGGCLFVTSLHGELFIFAVPPPSADAHPGK